MTHIPSILKPSWPVPDVFRSLEEHKRLKLRVDDVIEETTDTTSPTEEHVIQLPALGRNLLAQRIPGEGSLAVLNGPLIQTEPIRAPLR